MLIGSYRESALKFIFRIHFYLNPLVIFTHEKWIVFVLFSLSIFFLIIFFQHFLVCGLEYFPMVTFPINLFLQEIGHFS